MFQHADFVGCHMLLHPAVRCITIVWVSLCVWMAGSKTRVVQCWGELHTFRVVHPQQCGNSLAAMVNAIMVVLLQGVQLPLHADWL